MSEHEQSEVAIDASASGPDANRAVFDALWQRVLEAWDDDKPHHALLEFALKHEKLPELAGRYRSLSDDPEKGPRAKKRVDAIVLAATQMLMSMKSAPPQKSPAWLTFVAGVAMILLLGFLAYAMLGGGAAGAPRFKP